MIVGLSSLLMFIAQLVGLFLQATTTIQYIMHVYVILLCILAMLTELEWTSIVTDSKVLNNWITRGMFYAFIGTIGLMQDEAEPVRNNDKLGGRDADVMFTYAIAYFMIACGILYFCMGVLCLQLLTLKFRETHDGNLEMANRKKKNMKKAGQLIPPLKTTGDNIV
uniref:Uncharacterized protein n=1 Tax=Eucampia antarctica TaxID=49252 RepID=A0A7S2RLA0_9STRA